MDISTDHAEKEQVNRNSSSLPNEKDMQISDKAEALVIKENIMIVLHPEFIGDNVFNVPILDSTLNSNSKAIDNVTQANESFHRRHVSGSNHKTIMWKRVDQKVDFVTKEVGGISRTLRKKSEYLVQHKIGVKVETEKNKRTKTQDVNTNLFTMAKANTQPRQEQ